jgi:CP family cyanate transporter-like MFS transporter
VSAGVAAAGVVLLAFNLRIATSEIPPVLPDLAIGDVGRSVLATIPVLCFSLAAFAGPLVRSRLGEERALFVMASALLIGIVVRPVGPVWLLFAGTVLCGVAVAVMNVMMPGIVRRRFPRRVNEMTAAYTMALSTGAGLAAGLTIPIRTALGGSLPLALALWALPAAVALGLWIPQLSWSPPAHTQARGIAIGLLRDRLAWLITLYFGLQSMVFYILLSWLPAIYRAKGADPSTAGAVLGVVVAVGVVGNLAAPIMAARLRDVGVAMWATSGLTMLGLAGVLIAPTQTALVWACLIGVGTGGAFSIALLLLASGVRDAAAAARLSSMALGIGYLLAAPGPFLAGLIHAATQSWQLPLVLTIGVAAIQLAAGLGASRLEVPLPPSAGGGVRGEGR